MQLLSVVKNAPLSDFVDTLADSYSWKNLLSVGFSSLLEVDVPLDWSPWQVFTVRT